MSEDVDDLEFSELVIERDQLKDENKKLRAALEALCLQALQSSVNDPANEWGREALEIAHAALNEEKK